MSNLKIRVLAMTAAVLMSAPALAQINYSEDFESFTLHPGGGQSIGDLGGGWLFFANVFSDYPGCSAYVYGYGPFAAPNSDLAISGIVAGADGQALNVFSDYNNGDHGSGSCIETNVFKEMTFSGADAGSYDFKFDTEIPVELGANVSTYGFVKVLDPNDNYATVLFQKIGTAAAGSKTLTVDLDASFDGMILQWGFANTASNYDASGRVYDNVSFAPMQAPPPTGDGTVEGIPTLGTYGLLALLLLMGATAAVVLVRRT
jgi:hypothetical protein